MIKKPDKDTAEFILEYGRILPKIHKPDKFIRLLNEMNPDSYINQVELMRKKSFDYSMLLNNSSIDIGDSSSSELAFFIYNIPVLVDIDNSDFFRTKGQELEAKGLANGVLDHHPLGDNILYNLQNGQLSIRFLIADGNENTGRKSDSLRRALSRPDNSMRAIIRYYHRGLYQDADDFSGDIQTINLVLPSVSGYIDEKIQNAIIIN